MTFADTFMARWTTMYLLLKDGIPWEVLSKMTDTEVEILSVISSEISKVKSDQLASMG